MSTPLEKHRSRLTCCKCKKLYKDPKTLGCLHTFCSECLNVDGACTHPLAKTKLTEQRFTCGETPSKIPERIDQAVKNLVELLQQEDSAASGEAKCTFCTEGNNAVAFCRDCEREVQLLCQGCKDSHGKQRLTVKHQVVLLSELRSSQANAVGVQQRPWVCPHHEKEPEKVNEVSLYCFECQDTLCVMCAVTEPHSNNKHKIKSAKDVIAEVRAKLKEKVEAFTPVWEKFSTTIEEIKGTTERLMKCKEDKDKKIKERFQAIIQEITKQRDTLLTRNQAIFEKKKCILQDQLEAFYGVDAKVNDTLTATANIFEGIDMEVLQSKERLETRLDQLYNNYKDYPCDLKDNDIIIFEPNEDFNFSDSIGTVYSDLHPEESTLEGFENVHFIKGEKVELSLTCRDIMGTQLLNSNVGEQHIQAAMYPAGQEAQIYDGEVKIMGEGRFKIFFTPRAIGWHMLKVTINQRLVKNSPFEVLVSPQILKPVTARVVKRKEAVSNQRMTNPFGIAINPKDGMVAVSDNTTSYISIFDKDMKFIRSFSGDRDKEFRSPRGIAFDQKGRIVVVEKEAHRVQIVGINGEHIEVFGQKGCRDGEFDSPTDIAISSDGLICVSDSLNQRIQFFDQEGDFLYSFGQWGLGENEFHDVYALAFLSPNKLLASSRRSNKIHLVTITPESAPGNRLSCHSTRFFESCLAGQGSKVKLPVAIAIDPKYKYIFISEDVENTNRPLARTRISVFASNGKLLSSFPNDEISFLHPMGMCAAPNGRLLVTDCGNGQIVEIQVYEDELEH